MDNEQLDSLGLALGSCLKSTENFWNWFGKSVLVDNKGRPLVFWHGSPHLMDDFIDGRQTTSGRYGQEVSFWLTPCQHTAKHFSNEPSKQHLCERKGVFDKHDRRFRKGLGVALNAESQNFLRSNSRARQIGLDRVMFIDGNNLDKLHDVIEWTDPQFIPSSLLTLTKGALMPPSRRRPLPPEIEVELDAVDRRFKKQGYVYSAFIRAESVVFVQANEIDLNKERHAFVEEQFSLGVDAVVFKQAKTGPFNADEICIASPKMAVMRSREKSESFITHGPRCTEIELGNQMLEPTEVPTLNF